MIRFNAVWNKLGPRFLPFADAATEELPLNQLLRLSLFKVSVGMATVLLTGTLNRVMIVELGVPAWLVGLMVSLPVLFAPFRALIGHKSDTHRSVLGWRRVPYIWFGTMMQFGGFAIMPFALILLSGDSNGPAWIGQAGAGLAFLLVGAGINTTQTAGLALANDLAPERARPRVVALLYVMLLVGMVASAAAYGLLLRHFSEVRLIQVIQGVAAITMVLNGIALWKQEKRDPQATKANREEVPFRQALKGFMSAPRVLRLHIGLALGTAGFAMQDILLEPFGGQVFGMTVAQTTWLAGLVAVGTLLGLGLAARLLGRGGDPCRMASLGVLVGIFAFAGDVFAPATASPMLLRGASMLVGFGGGLFTVGILTAAMELATTKTSGLALGIWGAVQATAAGLAIAVSGLVRDGIGTLAVDGRLGTALQDKATGYSFVFHIEIALLFVTLIALGPLVSRRSSRTHAAPGSHLGLAQNSG
jgi:BCD family chlorophyll transporter-like MFS transporter